MTDISGWKTLQIIRLVDLHGKHNINFSHAASLHAAGVLRETATGVILIADPSPSRRCLSMSTLCLRESSLWTNVTHRRNHWFRGCLSNFVLPVYSLYSVDGDLASSIKYNCHLTRKDSLLKSNVLLREMGERFFFRGGEKKIQQRYNRLI